MASEAIRVEGLAGLVRDFGRMGKTLRTELQDELRAAAELVAEEARDEAERKGLRDTGRLIDSIGTRVGRSIAYVRATATSKHRTQDRVRVRSAAGARGGSRTAAAGTSTVRDFAYPKLYEYRDGGRRAFLAPALATRRAEVERRVERILDKVENQFERRT